MKVFKRPAADGKGPAAKVTKKKPAKKTLKKTKKKPASWVKLRPNGCSTCRYMPGCTPSCWMKRQGFLPA